MLPPRHNIHVHKLHQHRFNLKRKIQIITDSVPSTFTNNSKTINTHKSHSGIGGQSEILYTCRFSSVDSHNEFNFKSPPWMTVLKGKNSFSKRRSKTCTESQIAGIVRDIAYLCYLKKHVLCDGAPAEKLKQLQLLTR